MDTRFTGVIPPVVTPFTPDGLVDFDSLDRVVDHLLEGGVDGLFVLGSTGEVAYLTNAERQEITRRVVTRVAGRVPVLAGAIDSTARRAQQQAVALSQLGVDAIVAACPFYALNDQSEIADHFRMIKSVIGEMPLFAYDVPVRLNGVKLGLPLLMTLAKEGVIAGVKDSSGNDVAFRRLVAANEAAGHPLALLTGHECVVDGMLLLGGDGVVPGYANVNPRPYADLMAAARAGQWSRAREIQDAICAEFEMVFLPVGRSGDAAGVGAFKTAMAELGVIATNTMAPPVQALTGQTKEAIVNLMRECGMVQ
ncbi:dihydrodipicolinate synthase family protein [Actinomyces vulturis]|uniref:dihydrodipicolinate synthase family protein n=1 Tax=Actinomyces vulturis TaxID=1857645 RepID=UPI0008317E3A|nr:dihydrodipicolinate synthase family protein [Actinomyces vulturis]